MKVATRMKIKPGMEAEYALRHKQVFPELINEFKKADVIDYTIWLDQETNYLFALVEVNDFKMWNNISKSVACKEWWTYMAPIMEVNIDLSPQTKELQLVYKLD